MTITIVATPGSASANSYGTLAEADSYFASRVGSTAFTEKTDEVRKALLVTATMRLEAEIYRGNRASADQALQVPRTGLYRGGQVIDTAVVPVEFKYAEFEEALVLAAGMGDDGDQNPLAATGLEPFKSIRVGDIGLDMRDPAANDPSRELSSGAYRWLRPYLLTDTIGQPASIRNVRIIRQ